jgi:serine/threonine-protein kinase HipA
VPIDIRPRILTTAINLDDTTASISLAMEVAKYFELDLKDARQIVAKVKKAVATWRQEAAKLGLTADEINRMASAFEHGDE